MHWKTPPAGSAAEGQKNASLAQVVLCPRRANAAARAHDRQRLAGQQAFRLAKASPAFFSAGAIGSCIPDTRSPARRRAGLLHPRDTTSPASRQVGVNRTAGPHLGPLEAHTVRQMGAAKRNSPAFAGGPHQGRTGPQIVSLVMDLSAIRHTPRVARSVIMAVPHRLHSHGMTRVDQQQRHVDRAGNPGRGWRRSPQRKDPATAGVRLSSTDTSRHSATSPTAADWVPSGPPENAAHAPPPER